MPLLTSSRYIVYLVLLFCLTSNCWLLIQEDGRTEKGAVFARNVCIWPVVRSSTLMPALGLAKATSCSLGDQASPGAKKPEQDSYRVWSLLPSVRINCSFVLDWFWFCIYVLKSSHCLSGERLTSEMPDLSEGATNVVCFPVARS